MPVYLVTGAAGFIGANYVHHLLEWEPADAEVIAVDYLGFAGNHANLDPVSDRIVFEKVDIADLDTMEEIYRRYRPDFVVNFAAESHNDRAILEPTAFMRSNALGAQVMAECSRLVPVRSHVHVSTIEVYGELPAGDTWFTERSLLNAKTPYSAAKAAGDQIVRAYMQTYPELNIRMTHCANNYGPYQLPEKLIPLAVTNLLRAGRCPSTVTGCRAATGCMWRPLCRRPPCAARRPGIHSAGSGHRTAPAAGLRRVRSLRGHQPGHRHPGRHGTGPGPGGVDRAHP
jgi:dTDP-glucose 4,6-dehydratase